MTTRTSIYPMDIQRYVSDIDYPVSKEDLVSTARQQGVSSDVIVALEAMPEQEYGSPADVTAALLL